MKKQLLLFVAFLGMLHIGNAQATVDANGNIDFPDQNFKNALLNSSNIFFIVDTNSDGEISIEEAQNELSLRLPNYNISNVDGLEYFTNVRDINLNNNNIEEIDLSHFIDLRNLDINNNQLNEIDLSNNINLQSLSIGVNNISNLDLSQNTELDDLRASYNSFTEIDLSNNEKLEFIALSFSNLTSLDLRNCNSITHLAVEFSLELEYIYMSNTILDPIAEERLLETGEDLFTVDDQHQFINFFLHQCPLKLICADEEYIGDLNLLLAAATDYTDVTISTNCDPNEAPLEFSDVLTLWPNPMTETGEMNLSVSDFISADGVGLSVSTVYDLNGQLRGLFQHFSRFSVVTEAQVFYPNLDPGTYIIEVSLDDGSVYTTQFRKI